LFYKSYSMKKIVAFLTLCISILSVNAQTPFLDSTFGIGGRQEFTTTGIKVFSCIASDSNDYIYSAGIVTTNNYANTSILLTKSKQNGTADSTFGSQGIVISSLTPDGKDYINAIAVTPSQEIVVGGYATIGTVRNSLLAKYKSNGTLDSSFGVNGIVTHLTGASTRINALAVQSDGKIIAVGTSRINRSSIWVARYNSDGTLDGTFGMNGIDTIHYAASSWDSAIAVGIQSSGKIIVGGMTGTSAILTTMMLLRLNTDGTLDNTFGTNAFTTYVNTFLGGTLIDIALLQDGSIIANDYRPGSNSSIRPFVKKFSANGVFDPSFTNASQTGNPIDWGVVLDFATTTSTASFVNALVATPDGGVIGAGMVATYGGSYPAIVKLKANGQLDSAFGVNGLITDGYLSPTPPVWKKVEDVLIQKDGKIVIGANIGSAIYTFELDRYTNIPLYLGEDISICQGQSVTLDAQNPGSTYLWNTGATTQTISVSDSGTYYVTITTTKGSATDSIHIGYYPQPVVALGNDTAICSGKTLIIDAQNAGAGFLWNTGATTQSIAVTTSGTYYVTVTDLHNCSNSDTIQVTTLPAPVVDLGNDTLLAVSGTVVTLDAGNPGASYQWSDGGSGQTHNVINTGLYSVIVTGENGCSASDSVYVYFGSVGIYKPDDKDYKVTISPNPVNDMMTIAFEDLDQLLHTPLTVMDATGRIAKVFIIDRRVQSYTLSDLPSGIYFLKTIYGGNYKIVKR